jgi:hypothetical protein
MACADKKCVRDTLAIPASVGAETIEILNSGVP